MSVAGILPRGALAQQGFVVATYGGPYEGILRAGILEDFDGANATTTSLELGAGGRFLQQLLVSRGRPPFDVVYMNDDEALIGDRADLLEPINPELCPNISEIYDLAKPPITQLYSQSVYELGLVYNTEKMEEPETWESLWEQDITVGVPNPILSYGMLFLLVSARLNGGGESNLAPGYEQIKKLPSFKIYRGFVEAMELFRAGEIHATLFFKNRAVQMQKQGLPVKFIAPEGGNFGMISGVRIPKDARNPELAHVWANMVMSREFQEKFVAGQYSPTNMNVEIEPALAEEHIYGAEAIAALNTPDWGTMNQYKSEVYERWDREFS